MLKTHAAGPIAALGTLVLGALMIVGCSSPSGGGTGGKGGSGTGGKGGAGGVATGTGGVTGTGGQVDAGGSTGGVTGTGGVTATGGTTGTGGATATGGVTGTGGAATDGGSDATTTADAGTDATTTPPCGGCISMTVPFTTAPQQHLLQIQFGGTNGADLHGATITARVKVVTTGNSGALQLYPQDINYSSDYGHGAYVSPLPGDWTNLVYHVPAVPLPDGDGGIAYDTTKIRQIQLELDSVAPPVDAGVTVSTTTVWVDSISITDAPPPTGGGTYAPYTFDQNISPVSDPGGTPAATVMWIP